MDSQETKNNLKSSSHREDTKSPSSMRNFIKKITAGIASLGFIGAYTHFFGMSYRRSFLEGAGFESMSLTLTSDESIYYATQGFSRVLAKLISSDVFDLNHVQVVMGCTFALAAIGWWFVKRFFPYDDLETEATNSKSLKLKLKLYFNSFHESVFKTLLVTTVAFIVGYCFQLVIAFCLVFILALFWLILYLGIGTGYSDGQGLVTSPVCDELVWGETEKNRIIGCRKIILKDNTELTGLRVHSDGNLMYLITNEGAYEISSDKQIVSYRPINERPGDAKKPIANIIEVQ